MFVSQDLDRLVPAEVTAGTVLAHYTAIFSKRRFKKNVYQVKQLFMADWKSVEVAAGHREINRCQTRQL